MTKNTRIALFVIIDLICFNASYLLAYLLAHIGMTSGEETAIGNYFSVYPTGFLILIIVKLIAMYAFSVYRIIFEYAGGRDYQRLVLSLIASTFASVTVAAFLNIEPALVQAVILFSLIFDLAFVLLARIVYIRQIAGRLEGTETGEEKENQSLRRRYAPRRKSEKRVMVIGRGREAADLIAEMQANENQGRRPEIIVDDDKDHEGDTIHGIEIAVGRMEITRRARRQAIDEIIIAKPTASRRQIAALLRECVKTRCTISMLPRTLPSEAAQETATLASLLKPTVKDLLGRDRPRVDHREIGDLIKGRVVLVTGGAGVFGSEMCKRIIRYRPRRLIAVDLDEDGLALLAAELEAYRTSETEFHPVIASVRDQVMMHRAFAAFRPHIVFHAAELKQIGLAQMNPREAFLTNVYGLKLACDLADEFSAEKFILCSTVRTAWPMNVAAECKRIAELYVKEKNEKSHTAYMTVRFPNLIEGRGNVIALFEKQLKEGGPLTVTDRDITRRFISAEESVLLTVLALTKGAGGEVFELGPGEPIGINELAEAMICLSGKIPGEDVMVTLTHLRNDERLFESIKQDDSPSAPIHPERIWRVTDDEDIQLPHWSKLWGQSPEQLDDETVMKMLQQIFPAYKMKTAGNTSRGERIENEEGN